MSRLFLDEASGILYDTAVDAELLVARPRSSWDGATPAASSIALEVFARLFLLTGNSCWHGRAEGLLRSLSAGLTSYPAGYTQLLQSAAWMLEPARGVIIAGQAHSQAVEAMLSAAKRPFAVNTEIIFRPEPLPDNLRKAAPYLEAMTAGTHDVLAFVCQDFSCREPLTDPETLEKLLQNPP